jgi:hypothetical protein
VKKKPLKKSSNKLKTPKSTLRNFPSNIYQEEEEENGCHKLPEISSCRKLSLFETLITKSTI